MIRQRLRQARDDARLSQMQLAFRSGVDVNTISRMERGERDNPTAETLRKLARALGVTTDWLLAEDEVEGDEAEAERALP